MNIPLEKWLREDEFFISKLELLKSSNSILSNYANLEKLKFYVDGYLSKKFTLKNVDLFRLLCVEEWLQLIKKHTKNI